MDRISWSNSLSVIVCTSEHRSENIRRFVAASRNRRALETDKTDDINKQANGKAKEVTR